MDKDGYIKYDDLNEFISNAILFRVIVKKFMTWYNRDIRITSLFRGRDHNTLVGGVKYSKHLLDCAMDFNYPIDYSSWANVRRAEFRQNIKNKATELAEGHGVSVGLIFYNDRNCIHMDFCVRDKHYIHDMYE